MERSIKKDAMSSYANLFISIITALVLVPVIESHVGKSYYGIYQFVISLTVYSELMSIGLGKTIERYVAKYTEEKRENMEGAVVSIVLSIYIVTGLLFLVGVGLLYWQFGNIFNFSGSELELAKLSFLIASFSAGLNVPASLFQSHLRGRGRFSLIFNLGTVKALIKVVIVLAVLRAGYGIVAVFVVDMILLQTVNLLFAVVSVTSYKLKIQLFHIDRELFRKLFQYTTFVFLSGIAHTLYWNTDNIILGMYTNADMIAEYALSQRLIDYFYRYGVAFSGLFLPKFMEHYVVKDFKESNQKLINLFTSSSRVMAILMSFAVVNFIVLGRDFILLWIGPEYSMTYVYALIILIPYWLVLCQFTGVEMAYVMKKHKITTLIYFGSAVVNIVATVYLVKRIGPIGAALATGGTLFLGSFLLSSLYFRTLLKMKLIPFIKVVYLKNALISMIGILFGFGLNSMMTEVTWFYFLGKGLLMNLFFVPLILFGLALPEERKRIAQKLHLS